MTATDLLKSLNLIGAGPEYAHLIIKKDGQEWNVSDLIEKYATYRVALYVKKQELIEQFTSRLQYIGFEEGDFEFTGLPANDYITIRFGYWRHMDSDKLLRLQQLSGLEHKITEDYCEDDDGDDDDGRPMIIKRWSYHVAIDAGQL